MSGTLSYAVGAGKAIISTPYAYARELLADGRGLLVQPDSATAMAAGLGPLLESTQLRASMAQRAYGFGRRMTWSQVGSAYREVFSQVVEEGDAATAPLRVLEADRLVAQA